MNKKSIIALTQGSSHPSSFFRCGQFADNYISSGFNFVESRPLFEAYAPKNKLLRPFWLCGSVSENFFRVINSRRFDLAILQRNLTATLATWERLLAPPFIFDVDDAIFLEPRGSTSDSISKMAQITICGNEFIADHYSSFGRVEILPTAVDCDKFAPLLIPNNFNKKVIGWVGTSSNFKYLYSIESALKQVLLRFPNSILKIVSDIRPNFKHLPPESVIFEKWSRSNEATVLQDFSVGIMPLLDSPWARGKCSFKMLTYMASGLPVVVSPVGMNQTLLDQGNIGFGARSIDDWIDGLSCILSSKADVHSMGMEGRAIVESNYSKKIIFQKLEKIINELDL